MWRIPRVFAHPITLVGVFLAVLCGNAAVWHNPAVGLALLAVFAIGFGGWTGRRAAPGEPAAIRAWIGTWTLLSTIMVVGAACYYAASFAAPAALSLAALAGPVAWLVGKKGAAHGPRAHDYLSSARHRIPASVWLAAILCAAGLAATAWFLAAGATTDASRSLWQNVSPPAFVCFGLSAILLFALLFRGRERALTIPLAMGALGVFLCAAALVFPIGFGFDPFIHQATEEHIAQYGSITPKPFYYVGQYVLVLFLHHAFALPIAQANVLLVPLLAAVLLPLAWETAAAHLLRDKTAAARSLAGLFLLPLSSFVLTTPQGLANLWTLLLALAAVPFLVRDEKPRPWPLALPAFAAVATHPIAGLPAALFVVLLAANPRQNGERVLARIIFWSAAALGSILLPLSFVANSLLTTGSPGLNLSDPSSLPDLSSLSLFVANRFDPLLDFVYLYGFNTVPLFTILALAGFALARRTMRGALRIHLLMAAMLMVNWALLRSAVDFSFLIDYERQNFAARLVPLALFFLAPGAIMAVGAWLARVRPGPVSVRVASVALLAGLAAASFYLAYPRNDAYEAGHGYTMGRADLDAVHGIERDAAGTPYAVLSNQTVSAAAVRELGFARYYGDLFFYPIPTGGDLYAFFLRMNDAPSRDTARAALDLMNARCAADPACTQADTDRLYYVVNDYWWEAPRIVETGKQTADRWWALDGGKVHVFVYEEIGSGL